VKPIHESPTPISPERQQANGIEMQPGLNKPVGQKRHKGNQKELIFQHPNLDIIKIVWVIREN